MPTLISPGLNSSQVYLFLSSPSLSPTLRHFYFHCFGLIIKLIDPFIATPTEESETSTEIEENAFASPNALVVDPSTKEAINADQEQERKADASAACFLDSIPNRSKRC